MKRAQLLERRRAIHEEVESELSEKLFELYYPVIFHRDNLMGYADRVKKGEQGDIAQIIHHVEIIHENTTSGATPSLLAKEYGRHPSTIRKHLAKARRLGYITVTDNLDSENVEGFRKFVASEIRMRERPSRP